MCCFLTLSTLSANPGRNIWMEIVQKLVAVFLVSVVASANGLQLSVAVTLTMAATSAMVQLYARPQVRFGLDSVMIFPYSMRFSDYACLKFMPTVR